MATKVLYLFTSEYPYGSHESYLENEISFLSQKFDVIYLFPRNNKKGAIRKVPSNVSVINTHDLDYFPKGIIVKNIFLILKILFVELIHTNNKKYFLKNIRKWNSSIIQCINLSDYVKSHISDHASDSNTKQIYYSYWMNDWALMLAILKEKGVIKKFIFRVLGFDIYDERWEQGYMPFRFFIYSKTAKVFAVSKHAEAYIKSKKIYPQKVMHSYLGTSDYGMAVIPSKTDFTIYSCSNIIKLKRLPLIVEILKHIKFNIKWIHRGEGEKKAELMELTKTLPPNVKFELLPRENNYENVLLHFKNTPVNLFINVSESEGLPVTIIEAVSMGVPILATNVGGTSEIVNERTGILIDKDFNPVEVASIITFFRENNKNTIVYRNELREYWLDYFSASKNYEIFCKELLSLEN